MRVPRMRGARHLVLAGVLLCSASITDAATFTVTNTEASGAGSLRQAVLDSIAMGDAGGDTIVFTLPVDSNGIILLDDDLPTPTNPLTIDATGTVLPNVSGDTFQLLLVDEVDTTVVDLGFGLGDIGIGDGDTLTFTANTDFTVSSVVADADGAPGAIVKDGDATLSLIGANTFTGTLTIEAGTLIGNTASLPLQVTNDAALVFDQIADGTYDGVVGGTGSLEKRGAGDLTLTGEHTFMGGTTVSEGELLVIDEGLPGTIAIEEDASLVFAQNTEDGTVDGDISGAGSLRKTGGQDLTLTGTNSYTGGTTVTQGALIGDAFAIQGDVVLQNNASLVFDEPAGGVHTGVISGTGSLTKQGSGSLRLSGANTYTEGTTVSDGTLIVNSTSLPPGNVDTQVALGASLVFDQTFDGTFAGAIDGTGSFEKTGNGTLTLTEVQPLTGPASISAGTLELAMAASLMAPLDVAAGGTLSGTGSAIAGTTISGAISPGSAGQGVINVSSPIFEPSSQLVVEVDEGPERIDDQLDAGTSAVTINGSPFLDVIPAPGTYTTLREKDVLVGGSPLTGSFDLGEEFAFLDVDFLASPAPGEITITVVTKGVSVATVGTTENQNAVGSALATVSGDPGLTELFQNLNTLRISQAGAALDALSGEPISAFTTARVAMGERLQRTLHRRMRSVLFSTEEQWPDWIPSAGGGTAPAGVAAGVRPGERGIGGWIDGYGVFGDQDGDGNGSQVDYQIFGTTAGADFRLGDRVLAGVAAGYARTDVELDDRESDSDADSAQAALYAAYASPLLYAGLSGRYAWTNADSTRDIDIGTISERARGDFDSHDFGLRGELAVNAFEASNVRLQPLGAFEWSHLTRESFDETGAGSLSLDVDSEDLDSALLQLGGRVETHFVIGEEEATAVLVPELRAYWLHEFGDEVREVDAAIAGAPFTVKGPEIERDSALVGTGWALSLGRNVRATADYDVRIDAERLEHVGNISVRVRF